MPDPIRLDTGPVTIDQVVSVARGGSKVRVGPTAMARMARSLRVVEQSLADGRPHYGINTGFGSLSRTRIDPGRLRELQANLVRSHAAGFGPPLPHDVVRAMIFLTAASLARGLSGVRPAVVRALADLLNAGVTPVVPEVGSVGASGDLAPLAHAALVLIGEGRAEFGGRTMSGAAALRAAGLDPITPEAKEGLALINGTHLMAGRGSLVMHDAGRLVDAALVATAMSMDACRATDAFLDPRVYIARGHPGPAAAAARLRELLSGSTIIPSHRTNDPRVQDPYSLRCAPVVVGAAMDALDHAGACLSRELGAVTDNPLVLGGGRASIVSAGNFHGMPVAVPLDLAAIAVSHVAGISERRTFMMLAAADPELHLVPYLSPKPGLHSGLMIAQYTAAACCNEIIGLASPASVANIPTSAGVEDYNSFGPRSAAKAGRAVELARAVVAVELICAAEGVGRHRPLVTGAGVERAIRTLRRVVPPYRADRSPAPDIAAVAGLIADGAFGGSAGDRPARRRARR